MYRFSNRNRSKRRRVIPARPRREPMQPPRIFANIRIYIHPCNINGSRRKVLHNLIQKYGGTYALVVDDDTTHVLVDESVSSGKLCRSLGWATFPPDLTVLMVSWLSSSIRAGRVVNPVDYEIPCTHRPTFATVHHCATSESTAATGLPDNECPSSGASSSVLSEDADAELPNFGYVYEEGSTYDDGKYDEETSCDDEWLCERPIIPSNTFGIVNPCNPNPCGTFPTSSFSSTTNFRSLVPLPHWKRLKMEYVPPALRPNTLAARLSRVRVRKIPEHLRVPGGRSIIVDLNRGNFSQSSSKNIVEDKKVKPSGSKEVLKETETSSTDEQARAPKIPKNSFVGRKTECTRNLSKSFDCQFDNYSSVSKSAPATHHNPNTKSSTEISKDKNIKSVTVFSPNEEFDVESVNEVADVVKMMVQSVYEVAVNEEIINESVEEISKNAMEIDDSADETWKNENAVVSDVLIRVVEDVAKTKKDSKIKIVKVESLKEKSEMMSEVIDLLNTIEMRNNLERIENDLAKVEDEINAIEDKILNPKELVKSEPSQEMSLENICTEFVEVNSTVPVLPVSQLPLITDVSPYPVRLFCSAGFDSSALHNLSDDPTKREPVECITAEISHPSNLELLDCEVANNSYASSFTHKIELLDCEVANSSYVSSSTNKAELIDCEVANNSNAPSSSNRASELEITNQARSCGRPDITGPNIFFPFPIASSSGTSSSLNRADSTNQRPASPLFGACHSPNHEIIKKLQVLHESFKKTGEKWRIDVYGKAIFSLAKYPKAIESLEEIQSLNGIKSRKIAQKIWQIAQTGHLKEVDEINIRQSEEIRKRFSRSWGISPRIARKLVEEGCYSLSDLRTKSNLSRSQLVGLRYYEDLKTKMSEKEASHIFLTVLKIIFEKYPDVQCDACSSLRRNKKFCGSVSILVTLQKGCDKNDHRVLPDIVAKLHQLGYLTDDLIRHEENGEQTKYVGIFKLGKSSKHRRIEITVCTREEYACALLFLTGSSYFNRAIQQWAIKNEMVLDEHSLRIRLLNSCGGTDAVTRLHTPDEKTVFRFLRLPYRTPEQRDRFIM